MRTIYSRGLGLLLVSAILLPLACSDHPDLRLRYDCERLYYLANRDLQQHHLLSGGTRPVDPREAIAGFRRVVDRFWGEGFTPEVTEASEAQRQAWYLAGRAHLKIGQLYYRSNDYLQAGVEFSEIAASYPLNPYESAMALYHGGTIAELRGDYERALEKYERITEEYRPTKEDQTTPEPLLVGVPILRAEVFAKRGEIERFHSELKRARSYYRRLYDRDPKALLAAAVLGKIASTYLLESEPSKAIETLSELMDEQGNVPPPVLLRIAQIYLEHARDYRNAGEAFSRYLALYPDRKEAAAAQFGVGLSCFHRGEYRRATGELLKVEKRYPDNWQQITKAHFLYAQCFERMGDWQRAFTEFTWIKVNFPASPEGLEVPFYIAQYYERSGEKRLAADSFEKGIEFYRKIVDTYSKTSVAPIAQNYIARSLLSLGRWREAAETFMALAERFPGSQLASGSLLAAADIYKLKLDDRASAANSLREYLERYPHSPHADKMRGEIESLEA